MPRVARLRFLLIVHLFVAPAFAADLPPRPLEGQGGCVSLAGQEVAPPKLHPPAEVFEADLGGGVSSTVPVTPTLQGVREGRDEVLEKGIEVVSR